MLNYLTCASLFALTEQYTQLMSLQENSAAMLPSQKSMSEQKQANSIRKITIQTLSPIIAKLEEHISYLLQQTSKLRAENAKLAIATANQQALEKQFDLMNQNMDKLSAKLNAFNKDKDIKLKERDGQVRRLNEQLQALKKDSQTQGKQIAQISKSNDEYISRIDQNKEEQLQSIEQLKTNIQAYYEQELIKMEGIREEFEDTKHTVKVQQEQREADQQEITQILNITGLYESERGDIKKAIEKTAYLENNVVMLPDYEKDRKYQRLDNEQTKHDVRVMLDEALTPEIRRFLPTLISKLNDLQQFQATLTAIDSKFKETNLTQQAKMQQLANSWQEKFNTHQKDNEKAFEDIHKKINKNLDALEDKIEINEEKASSRLRPLEDQLPQLQKRWKSSLKQSLVKLDCQLKEYLNVWGEQFLDRKKDNIYQMVQTQKPPEQHKEEHRVQQLVYSMEPLLNSVKQELKAAQNQVQSSKETLFERLSFFNNQIVKIKSDITKETTETKRVLDTFSFRLNDNRDTCEDLSLLLSKLVETTAISYALSLDQSFLRRQHEVYVTYNDGILLEVADNAHLNYRRQDYVPELLKRAVLSELVKTIDHSIVSKPLLSWGRNEFKPSHFSQSIHNSYQALLEENKGCIAQPKAVSRPLATERKSENKQASRRQHQSHHIAKPTPNNQIFSKTIDPDSHDFRAFNSATRYDVGHEQNRQYTSRRKNIKLKKIDKTVDKKEH